MDLYIKNIISKLIDNYGFFVEEYSIIGCENKEWVALRFEGNNVVAVMFSTLKDYEVKARSLMSYLEMKGYNNIDINNVIMDNFDNITQDFFERTYYSKIALDLKGNRIVGCSREAQNLAAIIQNFIAGDNRKSNPKKKIRASVTYTLIGINIFVYLISAYLSGSIFDISGKVLLIMGAKHNYLIRMGQYYRLVTAMFLHGGLLHIALNMYALKSLGEMVENIYGKYKYLAIYFVSGIIASIASFVFSESMSVGASGAIFGLLGASLIFALKMKNRIGKDFLINIASVIAINIFIGMNMPNIDNYGHIGGLVGGVLISSILFRDNY